MKKIQIEIKWTIIYMIVILAWSVIGKLSGFHDIRIEYNLLFNTLIIIPSFIIYLLAIKDKRDSFYHGVFSYKQGLISGLVITFFITILGPLSPVFLSLISPDFYENSIRFAVAGKMMTMAEAKEQFNLYTFIVQGIVGAILFGAVYSFIGAALIKKNVQTLQKA